MNYFDIICASDADYGFGMVENDKFSIPWEDKTDMTFFKNKTIYTENPTLKNIIVMGKNTYNSIGKILKNRINVILTSDKTLVVENAIIIHEFNDVFNIKNYENIFLIGGVKTINEQLNNPHLRYIYFNKLNKIYNCNLKINPFLKLNFLKILEQKKLDNMTMYKLENKSIKDEMNYLKLLKNIFEYGSKRETRNSETFSLFGKNLSFDLKDKIPILTTKRVFFRAIVEELLWFLKGETDSKILENKNINIWKGNSCKEFLESVNLEYREGDIGPMYGFNWIHYGEEYKGCDNNYENKGFNQLEYCLDLLKNDPNSRRIIMTTFNASEAKKGVLYPCHGIVTQFYITIKDGIRYLSCNMYQRSADMFLGVPFNITSYSLLCYIICDILNNTTTFTYKPDKLNISFGDLHIYCDHIEQVHKQLNRIPYKFPKLKIMKKLINFNEIEFEDFTLIDYVYHPSIKADMVS